MTTNLDRLWSPKFKVGDIVRFKPSHATCRLNGMRGKIIMVKDEHCYQVEWESQGSESWPATTESESDLEKVD